MAPLLLYCERGGGGLWAEPINALSNAGYFWAAGRLWTQAAAQDALLARCRRLLAGLIALVGAGSLCFHMLATRWANALDVALIGLFCVVYLVVFLRIVARWPRASALAAAACFVLLDRAVAAALPAGLLNGSAFYLPALAALGVLAAYAMRIAPASARSLRSAAAVLVVALAVRTVDRDLCDAWPWGTHFVWHLLTAWVLYRLASALRVAPDRG